MGGATKNDAERHNEVSVCDTACATQASIMATVNGLVATLQHSLISREEDCKQPVDFCHCSISKRLIRGGFLFTIQSVATSVGARISNDAVAVAPGGTAEVFRGLSRSSRSAAIR